MAIDAPAATGVMPVSLREAFFYWLKLGFVSFGGPGGQIALMHADLVEKNRWISERRFLHALNYCVLLPGPEAMQLATYIGWLMHRTAGGLMAGGLFLLPSLLILIGLSWVYLAYGHLTLLAGILYGIKPAVIALVLVAAIRIGSRSLRNRWLAGIALLAFLMIAVIRLPFPAVIGSAAALGLAGGRWLPQHFQPDGHPQSATSGSRPALIDDHTLPPAHASFSWRRLWLTVGIGLALGVCLLLLLHFGFGWHHPLAHMGLFFTKAALLTFGGAYAVLPYVYQGAVADFGWLSAAQMIDGLALGETTPGPLIMIVAFVGFVGGWTRDVLAPLSPFWSGTVGALVAACFTFLPSFVFILAGGPLVEGSRGNLKLSAPLTAITAAVVGVIASLAVFFAIHVFRLALAPGHWDWTAILITAAAALALLRYRIGTMAMLAACAATGLVVS